MKFSKKLLAFVLVSAMAFASTACTASSAQATSDNTNGAENEAVDGFFWVTPEEGTVVIQTIYGQITEVIRPEHGGKTIFGTRGDDYFPVNMRTFTMPYDVQATAQNAPLTIKVQVTGSIINTDEAIKAYVRKYGLNAAERHARRNELITGLVNTETKNVVSPIEAYALLSNQETIQRQITERLKPIFRDQLFINLESIQILGRPDFVDDKIDNAASAVVAAQKQKEAVEAQQAANKLEAEGRLETAKIDAQRKQLEAQTYASPQYREIELKKLAIEEARAWASHNGPLVFGGGRGPQQTFEIK